MQAHINDQLSNTREFILGLKIYISINLRIDKAASVLFNFLGFIPTTIRLTNWFIEKLLFFEFWHVFYILLQLRTNWPVKQTVQAALA